MRHTRLFESETKHCHLKGKLAKTCVIRNQAVKLQLIMFGGIKVNCWNDTLGFIIHEVIQIQVSTSWWIIHIPAFRFLALLHRLLQLYVLRGSERRLIGSGQSHAHPPTSSRSGQEYRPSAITGRHYFNNQSTVVVRVPARPLLSILFEYSYFQVVCKQIYLCRHLNTKFTWRAMEESAWSKRIRNTGQRRRQHVMTVICCWRRNLGMAGRRR